MVPSPIRFHTSFLLIVSLEVLQHKPTHPRQSSASREQSDSQLTRAVRFPALSLGEHDGACVHPERELCSSSFLLTLLGNPQEREVTPGPGGPFLAHLLTSSLMSWWPGSQFTYLSMYLLIDLSSIYLSIHLPTIHLPSIHPSSQPFPPMAVDHLHRVYSTFPLGMWK